MKSDKHLYDHTQTHKQQLTLTNIYRGIPTDFPAYVGWPPPAPGALVCGALSSSGRRPEEMETHTST